MPDKQDVRFIGFDMECDLIRKVKIAAVNEGTTLRKWFAEAAMARLEEREAKPVVE